jgi:hypothetical protein
MKTCDHCKKLHRAIASFEDVAGLQQWPTNSGNEFILEPCLIDDLDEYAEAARRKARKAIDRPIWRAVFLGFDGARPWRLGTLEPPVTGNVSVDPFLEIGPDFLRRRALLDRQRLERGRSIFLDEGPEHIDGSFRKQHLGEAHPLLRTETARYGLGEAVAGLGAGHADGPTSAVGSVCRSYFGGCPGSERQKNGSNEIDAPSK